MGLDSGKHSGGYGRHDRRDYYQSDYSDYSASSTRSEHSKGAHKSVRFSEPAASPPATTQPPALLELEKKLSGMQKDFTQQLQGISDKETEKFDLIFAILTDLQSGQAQLEESIREIKKHAANAQNLPLNQGQFNNGGNFQCYGQMEGVMGSQMSPDMGSQQPVQQIVVQPDGTQAMLVAMPQVMVMQPPNGNMMVPQMQPMQPMQQMAVQFVGQGPVGQEMGSFPGAQVGNGEQRVDSDGKVPMLPEPGKHEGSDNDSIDTPTTGLSE